MSTDDKRIREFAYQIWESEGKPEGHEARHWEMARKLAEAEALAPKKSPRPLAANCRQDCDRQSHRKQDAGGQTQDACGRQSQAIQRRQSDSTGRKSRRKPRAPRKPPAN